MWLIVTVSFIRDKSSNEENKKLTPFPKGEDTDDTLPCPQRNLFTIKLYCTCRMPDIYDEKMISCDRCQKCITFAALIWPWVK